MKKSIQVKLKTYTAWKTEYLLKFKDDVTGTDGVSIRSQYRRTENGRLGKSGLKLTKFFLKTERLGIPTHYISADIETG